MKETVTMHIGLLVCLIVWSSGVVAQPATVKLSGPKTITLSADDLAAMPRTKVTATAHDQTATYEGVSMLELLTRAGVPASDALRGRELATVVVVRGADGYAVAYGVAEFDAGFTDRIAILADRKDEKPLTGDEAPFQLILTGEKRAARWVRQVVSIDVQPVGR